MKKAIPKKQKGLINDRIVGSCIEMCPEKERTLREREGLLHKLEYLVSLEGVPHQAPVVSSWPTEQSTNIGSLDSNSNSSRGGRNQRSNIVRRALPKADVQKTVKCFARSAAGQDKTLSEDLRPAPVLKKTVLYLCTEVLTNTDLPFNVIYDFIFDRLRAVRQDLVIQRIENEDAILLLETIVKFHIYSEFRLRQEPITIYEPQINQKHLVDCLRKLLTLYVFNDYCGPTRTQFEALQVLCFPGLLDTTETFAICYRESKLIIQSIDMALAFQSRNYVRFFRRMAELPTLLQMYCVRHVPVMRSWAYQIICSAYGVGTCKIPLVLLKSVLGYKSLPSVHRDLASLNIEVLRAENDTNTKFAKFLKANRATIELKTNSGIILNPEIHSASLDSISCDKSHKLASKLICPWC